MPNWMNGVGVATVGDFYGPDSGGTSDSGAFGGTMASTQASPTTISQLSNDSGDAAPAIHSVSLFKGLKGINPLLFIPLILGTIVLVRLLREWGEKDGEIKEARAGVYFGVMASLWTVALVPIYKAFLNKYHIPGLTEYVNNA